MKARLDPLRIWLSENQELEIGQDDGQRYLMLIEGKNQLVIENPIALLEALRTWT